MNPGPHKSQIAIGHYCMVLGILMHYMRVGEKGLALG